MPNNVVTETNEVPKPKNQQQWKMAASGAGVIICRRIEAGLEVLLSKRAKIVGEGLGITGGGFVKCDLLWKQPVGTVIQTADEAFGEACEENGGFERVISKDAFLERAQPVSLIHARIDDLNEVHVAAMYALRTQSTAEWNQFKALPPGVEDGGKSERSGPLLSFVVRWSSPIDRREPERYITIANAEGRQLRLGDFYHPHEFHAIAAIAWHEQNDKLW